MNILAKINQTFGFTSAERRVVIILLSTFLVGITIKVVRSAFGGPQQYNYASSDSAFAALSGTQNVPGYQTADSLKKFVTAKKSVIDSIIDINSATKAQLTGLPGIGDVIAERIISYRKSHGRFKSVRELMSVEGIGEKKFNKIASLVKIGAHNE